MKPLVKAHSIKRHFKIQCGLVTEEEIQKTSRAYIGRLLEDFDTTTGDFRKAFEHEWVNYTSYWAEVLKYL